MAIRIILLILSLAGYLFFAQDRLKIKRELCPFILCCSVTLLMFFGGILNCLVATTWAIIAGGIALLIFGIITTRPTISKLKSFFSFGIIFWIVGISWFCYICMGYINSTFDVFSHWGSFVKGLVLNDRLPSFKDTYIVHQTYPPATGLWIYFISKTIGYYSEGACVVIQNIFLLSGLTTIFAFVKTQNKKRRIAINAFVTLCAVTIMCMSPYFKCITVDAITPITAVAGLCVILYYRNNVKKAALLSIVSLTYITLIKNGTIFFALANFVVLLIFLSKAVKRYKLKGDSVSAKKSIILSLASIIVPSISLFLWNRHVNMVYPAPQMSRHAITPEFISSIISEKTPSDIYEITQLYIARLFSPTFYPIVCFFLCTAAVATILVMTKSRQGKLSKILLFSIVFNLAVVFAWSVALYLTYVLSMPIEIALDLGCIDRYISYATIYASGLYLVAIVMHLNSCRTDRKNLLRFALSIVIFTVVANYKILDGKTYVYNASLFTTEKYPESMLPIEIKNILKDVEIPTDATYIIHRLSDLENDSYINYIYTYYTLNGNSKLSIVHNISDYEKMYEYDYVIIMDAHTTLENNLLEHDFIQIKDKIYKKAGQ